MRNLILIFSPKNQWDAESGMEKATKNPAISDGVICGVSLEAGYFADWYPCAAMQLRYRFPIAEYRT